MITLIGIAPNVDPEPTDSPYRPRFVKVPVPGRTLPQVAARPSMFDGGVALVLIALCAALPIGLVIALMCQHGRTP